MSQHLDLTGNKKIGFSKIGLSMKISLKTPTAPLIAHHNNVSGSGGNPGLKKKQPSLTITATQNAQKKARQQKWQSAMNSNNSNNEDPSLRLNHKEDVVILRIVDPELLHKLSERSSHRDRVASPSFSDHDDDDDEERPFGDFLYLDPSAFSITFQEARKGTCSYEGKSYPVTLADLPCIIEAQKTFDHKRYFKTADIAQIMIIGALEESVEKRLEEERFSVIIFLMINYS